MIYCVVPEALEAELLDKLTAYYADDDNVTVIVDRRRSDRRNRRGTDGSDPPSPIPSRSSSARCATAAARACPATSRRSSPSSRSVKVVVHVDGGARGNPGPAAAAAVVSTPAGDLLDEASETLGVATNNVAEYRGLLLGLARARELGADEVELINDSELVAKQVNGAYKVKHPDMKALHAAALRALSGFERWSVRSVPRAQNADADALVNQALDALS